jgi:GTPase SAR1 family protein
MNSKQFPFVHVRFVMFISLFLSIFSIQAALLKADDEVNRSNIRKVFEKHTRENPNLLNSSKGKDIVVFLGKTGAGKSTLINYLSNKELQVGQYGNIVLKNPMDSSAMSIGVGGDSETFLPKFIQSNGLLFYDLPGFGDTRGTALSLVNACFIKNIIENAATARLVFVAGQDEMTAERGKSFKELTIITRGLVPNEIIEEFSSLVITKSTPGKTHQQIINFLQTKTDPEILASWIEQGRLVKMSSPFGENIDTNYQFNILDVISRTPSQKINNINSSKEQRTHKLDQELQV